MYLSPFPLNRWYNYGTSTDVDRLKHGYDRVGNRLYRQNTVATANGAAFDELYTYDGVNRLHEMERGTLNGTQSAILSPVFTECWTQDSTANWSGYRQGTNPGSWNLVQQRSVNKVNEIVSFANSVGSAWATPAYDPAGNMTTFPKASDPTTAQTAAYDAWYRLVKVSEGMNTVAAYQYDGVNRRTVQQNYTSGTLTDTRHLYYTTPGKWQVIEERIGTAAVPERQFVWGLRYVDDLVLRDRDTNGDGTLDERQYALQDANWNVTAIINSSGSVQERYAYSPHGVPVFLTSSFGSRSSSNSDWRNLFTGRRLDTETALYDFRYRVLSPVVGLFLARDPLGLPDGPSLYAAWFVPDSVDPYGLQIPTSGQCWLSLGNKTICVGDIIPTGPITLDFNLDEESILSYIFNVPANTYSVKSLQEAKAALDKYVSDKAHEAAKCGKPVCVPSITIAGHGANSGYIRFASKELISAPTIASYLAFINGKPIADIFEIGPGNVITEPPENVRLIQTLSEMIGKLCDDGRITILMCSTGTDTFNQQLRLLANQVGKSNIDIVTYKGDCGYSWGGTTAK
jgi:RHS repeat-associated protein